MKRGFQLGMNGCIDLSIRAAVDLNASDLTMHTAETSGPIWRQSTANTGSIVVGERSSSGCHIPDKLYDAMNTVASTIKSAQTPSELMSTSSLDVKTEACDLEAQHGERSQMVSSSSAVRSKNRKSGFQAGVTVGYTYDAFFVSDGRSRKCKVSDNQKQHTTELHLAHRRERNRSEQLNSGGSCSSSAHSSNSSGAFAEATSSPTTSSSVTSTSLSPVHPSAVAKTRAPACPRPLRTGGRYRCVECGKSYATSSNLSRHKQTHRSLDSQAARKCPHCGKAYVSMPALSMHILTHNLKHECDLCGKAFSRPWLLQGHRRAHTGEKPYGCAHCGRAFADRSNLRAHMQTHSGMKQWTCPRCHKTFALKSYLNKHLESTCVDREGEETGLENVNACFGLEPEGLYDGVGETGQLAKTMPDLAWSVTRLLDDCH